MSGMENDFWLVGCMEEIPDPRAAYNQKHKFLDIIVIAVTAIPCGMDTWNEIEDWAKSKREWLGTFLGLPGGIPSHGTINRVFQMIGPEKFHEAFFRWTGAVAGKIEGVVAIDGETVRRGRDDAKGNRPAHVVSAWACGASLVLGRLKVDEKTNEVKAISELLDILCLKGCVVTIDAMEAHKGIAEKIIDKEADYILQVKGNQGSLMGDIALYFEKDIFPCKKKDLEKEGRYYKDICFDHGRQETRGYYVGNEIGWLKVNHTERKGLSGIGAEEYGECKRAHWGVENSLHWVLDIGFREDGSRMRAGNAAESVNVLAI